MKNYLKIYLLLIISIFIYTSCDEDINLEDEQNSSKKDIELITNGNSNKVSSVNSMLHFSNIDIFKETLKNLEIEYENYDDTFLEQWGYLSDDKLDDKEDELGYTPQQPFIDFEKQFKGFKSLRKEIAEKEEVWLNNEVLDEATDPYNHFVFEEEMRTVLNPKGQVKVGKELIQMTMFGYIKITDGNFNTLDLVLNNDARELDLPNVIIVGSYDGTVDGSNTPSITTTDGTSGSTTTNYSTLAGDCRNSINTTQYYYPANNRKIKGYQKLGYSFWHGSSAMAKTRHFKKKWYGWRCRRDWIGVRVQGESTVSGGGNPLCSYNGNTNLNKYKRRRYVKVYESIPSSANATIGTKQHKLLTKHRRYSTEYTKYFWN